MVGVGEHCWVAFTWFKYLSGSFSWSCFGSCAGAAILPFLSSAISCPFFASSLHPWSRGTAFFAAANGGADLSTTLSHSSLRHMGVSLLSHH